MLEINAKRTRQSQRPEIEKQMYEYTRRRKRKW